jgi:flagellar biosynthesis protein FlhF
MEIRTYRADSIHDALQLVRRDLGPDAFVLQTREVRAGGVAGLLTGRKCTEVLASLEPPVSSRRRMTKRTPDHGLDLTEMG